MALPTAAEPVPFYVMENGGARLNGCRVALEGVIIMYKQGHSAEDIHRNLPTAGLAEIHAAIAYYLRHTAEVEAYLEELERESAEFDRKYRDPAKERAFAQELRRRWAERNAEAHR
jgi:uncharacterized protein (DUF433 family)